MSLTKKVFVLFAVVALTLPHSIALAGKAPVAGADKAERPAVAPDAQKADIVQKDQRNAQIDMIAQAEAGALTPIKIDPNQRIFAVGVMPVPVTGKKESSEVQSILGSMPNAKTERVVSPTETLVTYYANGKVIGTKTILKPDAKTTVTTWRSPENNTKQIETVVVRSPDHTFTSVENGSGQLLRQIDSFSNGSKQITEYSYASPTDTNWNRSVSRSYDPQGKVLSSTFNHKTNWVHMGIAYTETQTEVYNADNVLWQEFGTYKLKEPNQDWKVGYTYFHLFDANGNMTYSMTDEFYPVSSKQTGAFEYDENGVIIRSQVILLERDASHNLVRTITTVLENRVLTIIVQDAQGNLISKAVRQV